MGGRQVIKWESREKKKNTRLIIKTRVFPHIDTVKMCNIHFKSGPASANQGLTKSIFFFSYLKYSGTNEAIYRFMKAALT